MTAILGLNAFHADAAACLLVDGIVVAAVAEERLGQRIKHYAGFPSQAVASVLNMGDLTLQDIDYVAIGHNSAANLWQKGKFAARRPLASLGSVKTFLGRKGQLTGLRERLAEACGTPIGELIFETRHVEHHLAHAASSFYCSGFENAAALTYDASGDFVSTLFARCTAEHGIEPVRRIYLPHSLGYFYTSICQFIGFDHFGEEYKVMGLAAYGDECRYRELMEQIVSEREDGSFALNPEYFSGLLRRSHTDLVNEAGVLRIPPLYSPKLAAVLGEPRRRGSPIEDREIDLAAACQSHFESLVLNCLRWLYQEVDSPNLVTAGGAALNGVCNSRILRDTPYRQSYIHCAAGDDGTAVGAALYVWHDVLGGERTIPFRNAFLGPDHGDVSIREALTQFGLKPQHVTRSDLLARTADLLAQGQLVGWYQDRSEWGPRALGNRSILAHPGLAGMKETINRRVKRRETFRPFAPSILEDRVEDYFVQSVRSPFMQHVVEVRRERRKEIPAVTHIDGTARLQTVSRAQNDLFYDLIIEFEKITGLPLLLNTSFNENEPIVDTPAQAIACFLRNGLDALALGSFLVVKNTLSDSANPLSSGS